MTPRARHWLRTLRNVAIIYVVYLGALFFLQRMMLFPTWAVHEAHPEIANQAPGLIQLSLPTEVGHTEAWFIPGLNVDAAHPGPAVIFAHGNGELIEDWVFAMKSYRDLGISVLLPEYRGYGLSSGEPSEKTLTSDFVRFYDLLAARPEVDRTRIVIHGRSIGGAVACALAAQRKPAALVLQSTFASLARMAHRKLAPAFLLRDSFDNERIVASLGVPTFIAHGRRDSIIPYENGVLLAAAAKVQLVSYDANHNDCPPDWNDFMRSVAAFLRTSGVLR